MLTGDKRMQERPIGPLVDALRRNGCDIQYLRREGSLPLVCMCVHMHTCMRACICACVHASVRVYVCTRMHFCMYIQARARAHERMASCKSIFLLSQKIPANALKGGVIELSADVSSQYVSSILISAPYAEEVRHGCQCPPSCSKF